MSTLDGREGSALLVIDLQQGVVDGAYQREDVIEMAKSLVSRAREAQVPVVWIQHNDEELTRESDAWQWVDGLGPAGSEPLVEKQFGDAFADTTLEETLAGLGVADLILVGAASEQCIRSTMHGGVVRGYDVALVEGGHTTVDMTEWGMPEPAVIIGFMDSVAKYGMVWPGRSGRSVTPETVGF